MILFIILFNKTLIDLILFKKESFLISNQIIDVNKKAVGCGALKKHKDKTVEIKRMYTLPESRGSGVASKILQELEKLHTQSKRCGTGAGEFLFDQNLLKNN